MERDAILDRMVAVGAVRLGTFTLASGATSDHYFDVKQLLLDAEGLHLVAARVGGILREQYPNVVRVGGPELGVVPLVGAVVDGMRAFARHWAVLHPGAAVAASPSGFVVRKAPKGHGGGRLIEGPMIDDAPRGHPDYPRQTLVNVGGRTQDVAVLEDVVTTGGSLLRAVDVVRAAGGVCRVAVAVVDRRDTAGPLAAGQSFDYVSLYHAAHVLDYVRRTRAA